ncbi:TPA: hypothetical protein N0F65_000683 [Lagenidium giganteum]|uniref:protein-tyrosine-phosphatase n=1 Tax=Lagenidium giganteum TaxID=4803 RepID=A0AAV2YY61_9STRA|nr:TPA: hypothetical protein N0F65_000683 [Lagenidium giganteum]
MPMLGWGSGSKKYPRLEPQNSNSSDSVGSAGDVDVTEQSVATSLALEDVADSALTPVSPRKLKRRLNVPPISVTTLYNRLQTSGVVVVDCRSVEQYMSGYVLGALHCPHVRWKRKTVNQVLQLTGNELLLEKLSNRDLMEVVVVGSNRSSSPLLYKRDWGYKFARLLLAEGRVFSVQFLAQGFHFFAKKYPFLLMSSPLLCVGLGDPQSKLKNASTMQYPNEIIDSFMYLGNFWQANSEEVIRALDVTHIVNMGAITDDRTKFDGVEYLDIDIKDKECVDIRDQFEPVMEFIEAAAKAHGRVLIHCVQGVSRSSTIVIWYVMLTTKCTLSAAYSYVLKRRPLIFPNRGFMEQLMENERELYGAESVNMDELDLLQHGLLPPMDRAGSALRNSFA